MARPTSNSVTEAAVNSVDPLVPRAESSGVCERGCASNPLSVSTRPLRILYVGDFKSPGKSEQYAAAALKSVGQIVHTVHDADLASPEHLVSLLEKDDYDCFLFHKGCLGASNVEDRLYPTGEVIAEVLRGSKTPGYTWYFDRVYDYEFDRSRESWMRSIAPLCRVAFVTDGALAKTNWARWHVLRQGVSRSTVEPVFIPENKRIEVGFIGQLYGERHEELACLRKQIPVNIITGVFGKDLNRAICGHKIIVGPNYPSTSGYWSNRLYVVLGHGGFFLAPEVEGMSDEGFVPGRHYAAIGEDPLDAVEYWLKRPAERNRIARAGQQLVLDRYTYEHRVLEMLRIITETL